MGPRSSRSDAALRSNAVGASPNALLAALGETKLLRVILAALACWRRPRSNAGKRTRTHVTRASRAGLADNPIVWASDAFLRMTGYDRDEVQGRNCRFLQGPKTDARQVAVIRDAVANEHEASVTLLNYKKDGTTFWNRFFIAPLRDSDGAVTSALPRLLFGRDVALRWAAASSDSRSFGDAPWRRVAATPRRWTRLFRGCGSRRRRGGGRGYSVGADRGDAAAVGADSSRGDVARRRAAAPRPPPCRFYVGVQMDVTDSVNEHGLETVLRRASTASPEPPKRAGLEGVL